MGYCYLGKTQVAEVRCCNEARHYLELNYDNVVFEDTLAYPSQHFNVKNVGKIATTDRIDDSISIVNVVHDLTKVRIKVLNRVHIRLFTYMDLI